MTSVLGWLTYIKEGYKLMQQYVEKAITVEKFIHTINETSSPPCIVETQRLQNRILQTKGIW
jgi:hypothetical protein